MIDLSGFYCSNERCSDYGKTGGGNIVRSITLLFLLF